jgi:hypothetical protein
VRALPPQVVELRELEQLDQLCKDVRLPAAPTLGHQGLVRQRLEAAAQAQARKAALSRSYVVWLNDGVRFADFDADEGQLLVDVSSVYTMRGQLGLWSSHSEPVPVPATSAQAQELVTLQERGALRVRLFVALDADAEADDEGDSLNGEPCATRPGSAAYQLRVNALGGQLEDARDGRILGRFVTEAGRHVAPIAQHLLGDAQLRIGAPEGAGEAAGTVLRGLEVQRSVLQKCYTDHGEHAEGGVVIGLDVDKAGGVSHPGIDVTSMESDALHQCLLSAVQGASLKVSNAAPTHVTVPLTWSRGDEK